MTRDRSEARARELVTFRQIDPGLWECHVGATAFAKGDHEEIAHVYRAMVTEITAALRSARAEAFEEAAKLVPTSWLDPLLTGPDANLPDNLACKPFEDVLLAIAKRIREAGAR